MKINLGSMLHIAIMNHFGGTQRLLNSEKTPSKKSQRSPELVTQLKAKAEAKRQRKAEKRSLDYHQCISNNGCLV